MTTDVVEIIMDMKKKDDQYFGTTPILGSDSIAIPNAKQCRVNHRLVTAIPSEDITLGVLERRKVGAWKARVKSLERQKREIEERNRKKIGKRNREIEKAILEDNIGK